MYHICPAQCQIQLHRCEHGRRLALDASSSPRCLGRLDAVCACRPRRRRGAWINAATAPFSQAAATLSSRSRPGRPYWPCASIAGNPPPATGRPPAARSAGAVDLRLQRARKDLSGAPLLATISSLAVTQTPRPASSRSCRRRSRPRARTKRIISSGAGAPARDDAGPLLAMLREPRVDASTASHRAAGTALGFTSAVALASPRRPGASIQPACTAPP